MASWQEVCSDLEDILPIGIFEANDYDSNESDFVDEDLVYEISDIQEAINDDKTDENHCEKKQVMFRIQDVNVGRTPEDRLDSLISNLDFDLDSSYGSFEVEQLNFPRVHPPLDLDPPKVIFFEKR